LYIIATNPTSVRLTAQAKSQPDPKQIHDRNNLILHVLRYKSVIELQNCLSEIFGPRQHRVYCLPAIMFKQVISTPKQNGPGIHPGRRDFVNR